MAEIYFFRADGNAQMGAGHLMRCLAIAEALREQMEQDDRIVFVCADEGSGAIARQRGFEVLLSGTDYRKMEMEIPFWENLGNFQNQENFQNRGNREKPENRETSESREKPENRENPATQKTPGNDLDGTKRPCILVDSYYVTDTYLAKLREYGSVALLDDFGQKAFPVDLLVNYHVYADGAKYHALYERQKGEAHPVRFCLGAGFVPLRKEFSEAVYRKDALRVRETVKKVLLTTGGGDADNIGGTILKELIKAAPDLQYHIVAGSFYPHLAELEQLAKAHAGIRIEQNVKNMAALMAECDICVSAGGTTLYELASLGLPFICFSYAENQEALTEYIGAKQIAGYGGAWHRDREGTLCRICDLFMELLASEEKRVQYYQRERELTDGRGAQRIAAALREEGKCHRAE